MFLGPMLSLHNSLTNKLEPFTPISADGSVNMYVCGITPYDEPHVGHARAAVFYDILYRYLGVLGYRVNFIQNVTDIDDKIIERSHATSTSWRDIGLHNEAIYDKAMLELNVLPHGVFRATAFIDEMADDIRELLAADKAYRTDDGIYFRTNDEGRLSNRKKRDQRSVDSDFVLWKYAKPGEPSWRPDGFLAGRPGWHTECATMSMHLTHGRLDIHGGGNDLLFPHHENELALMEALWSTEAKYWVHSGLLTDATGQKMGKSLGNHVNLSGLLRRYGGQALRHYFMQNNYRKPMRFVETHLTTAQKHADELKSFLASYPAAGSDWEEDAFYDLAFRSAMDANINTAKALVIMNDWRAAIKSRNITLMSPSFLKALWVLGLDTHGIMVM